MQQGAHQEDAAPLGLGTRFHFWREEAEVIKYFSLEIYEIIWKKWEKISAIQENRACSETVPFMAQSPIPARQTRPDRFKKRAEVKEVARFSMLWRRCIIPSIFNFLLSYKNIAKRTLSVIQFAQNDIT